VNLLADRPQLAAIKSQNLLKPRKTRAQSLWIVAATHESKHDTVLEPARGVLGPLASLCRALSRALRVALWLLPRARRTHACAGRPGSKTETTSATEAAAAPASAAQALPEETTGAATQAGATADDAPPAPRSLFDFLGYDELREVVDWLDGEDLLLLRDSGVVGSPHSGLIKKWTSRWTRNAALQACFAFLEPGDLGTVVAAFFVSDVALASAAHSASTAALRAGGRRRVPLAATDIITAV
jgi:hypothetical protein